MGAALPAGNEHLAHCATAPSCLCRRRLGMNDPWIVYVGKDDKAHGRDPRSDIEGTSQHWIHEKSSWVI